MEVFDVLKYIFGQAVAWLQSIPVFGTNLFVFVVGFLAVSFGVTAIRFLFGGDRGGSNRG